MVTFFYQAIFTRMIDESLKSEYNMWQKGSDTMDIQFQYPKLKRKKQLSADQVLDQSFYISRFKKMRVNPSLLRMNKRRVKHAKKYGILFHQHKIGGIELDRKYAKRIQVGKYIPETELESTMNSLVGEKRYGIFKVTRQLGAMHKRDIATVTIEKSSMKAAANPLKFDHFDTGQVVDGSSFRYLNQGQEYRLQPGTYLSVRDLEKSLERRVQITLPASFTNSLTKIKALGKRFGSTWKQVATRIIFEPEQSETEKNTVAEVTEPSPIPTYVAPLHRFREQMKVWKKPAAILGTVAVLGCGGLALAPQSSDPAPERNREITIASPAAIFPTYDLAPSEEEMGICAEELRIGDVTTLTDTTQYYRDSSLTGPGVSVFNSYVSPEDDNLVSAAAIIDPVGNLVCVTYEEGTLMADLIYEADQLGEGYQVVVHYGPLTENQNIACNPHELGWATLDSVNQIKQNQKIYTKTV